MEELVFEQFLYNFEQMFPLEQTQYFLGIMSFPGTTEDFLLNI